MMTYEEIRSKIHPVPQQVTVQEAAALAFPKYIHFFVICPEGTGCVATAKEQLLRQLRAIWGEDCLSPEGIPVTLTIGSAPEGIPSEGYCLQVTAQSITVTGFSEKGLLYGTFSLMQLLEEGNSLPVFEILDWPDKAIRGYRQESRWGSNMMEQEDWFALVEDIAKKS